MKNKKVVVIGASNKPQRYSYMAISKLREAGHEVFPVHPRIREIQGIDVFSDVTDIKATIDTVTMYVNSAKSDKMISSILALNPMRIIFNPGAENPELFRQARGQGIEVLEACTLVMLSIGTF